MKKMMTSCLIALAVTFTAIKPQKAEAGIIFTSIILVSSKIVTSTTNSELLGGIVGIGAAIGSYNFVVKLVNTNWNWWTVPGTYVNLLVFNEAVEASQVDSALSKMFPEVNDMSVISDLSNAILTDFDMSNLDKETVEVKLAPEVTESILERSDLNAQQIQKIVQQLK